MRKFKHKNTGRIALTNNSTLAKIELPLKDEFDYFPTWMLENSKDWEEVVEKEYEVLSVITKDNEIWSKERSVFFSPNGKVWVNLTTFGENWRIHSVKRLSDGEVFTIGDKVKGFSNSDKQDNDFVVNKIEILGNDIILKAIIPCIINLQLAEKVKQPLFITEDKEEIFKGDKFYVIETKYNSYKMHETIGGHFTKQSSDRKRYANINKANEFILINKPCLSINDIVYGSKVINPPFAFVKEELMDYFKSLVKSKGNL